MLSVLIPIYNYDCRALIKDLITQLEDIATEYEILAYDDGSTLLKKENSEISYYQNCKYVVLERNIGRSAIRNLLAQNASYDYLLFMDCDSKIIDKDYIRKYIDNASPSSVICGGRRFPELESVSSDYILHCKIGTKREPLPGNNDGMFLSNNFLIPKAIFESIRFDERIREYGHEDTLFGIMLEKKNIKVKNLFIPIEHEGLDRKSDFLDKTKEGVKNLAFITNNILTQDEALRIKLYRICYKLDKLRLLSLLSFMIKRSEKLILKNLYSTTPSLYAFDLYKTGLMCNYLKGSRKRNK